MGWCSGSQLANQVFDMVKEFLPEDKKKEVATKIYDIFMDHDADCWEDPDGIEGMVHPEWFKEDE